jgi:hypothetical protein
VNVTQATSNITPAVTTDGGTGTDSMTINHSTGSTGFTSVPTISNTTLVFLAGRNIDYTAFESMVWNSLVAENKAMFIVSTPATMSLTLNGSSLSEAYNFGGLPGFFGTVSLDPILGPVTVNGNGGSDLIRFSDNTTAAAKTYTLDATTFTRTGIPTITYATTENITINGTLGDDTINVADHPAGAVVTVDAREGLDFVNVNSDGVGTATVNFPAQFITTGQDLASLNILDGGTVIVAANGANVIDTDLLTIAATGKLDLNDNDMIVDYPTSTVRVAIQNLINSGRAGGAWTGNGITSTAAKTRVPKNTTLGVLEASQFKALYGAGATFSGRTIDTTAVLVKYTYYGDADFNGTVNFDDYSHTDLGFALGRFGWFNGDYDGNGVVNFDDYSLLDLAFNSQSGTL